MQQRFAYCAYVREAGGVNAAAARPGAAMLRPLVSRSWETSGVLRHRIEESIDGEIHRKPQLVRSSIIRTTAPATQCRGHGDPSTTKSYVRLHSLNSFVASSPDCQFVSIHVEGRIQPAPNLVSWLRTRNY